MLRRHSRRLSELEIPGHLRLDLGRGPTAAACAHGRRSRRHGELRLVGTKRTGARPQAQAEVVPFPAEAPKLRLARLAPTTRSILAGLVILLSGAGAYVAARQTSLFALRTIEVRGASPALEGRVRDALAPLLGKSLVALDSGAAAARVAK